MNWLSDHFSAVLSFFSVLIAIAAVWFSRQGYRLNLKLQNENKIFEEKIRTYHVLIKATNDTMGVILGAIGDYDTLKQERASDIDEKADALNDEIDDAINDLEDTIAENTLVIPNEILELLYDFLDLIDKEEYLDTYRRHSKMEKLQALVNEAFDQLVVAMQEDLGFEKLDTSLKHRTGGKRATQDLRED